MCIQHVGSSFSAFLFSQIKNKDYTKKDVTLEVISICEIPANVILKTIGLGPLSRYEVNPNKKYTVIEIADKQVTYKTSHIALSILFVLPGCLTAMALKTILFLASSNYRQQLSLLANYLTEQKKQPIPMVISQYTSQNLPGKLGVIPIHVFAECILPFLSPQELGRMERSNKALCGAVQPLWKQMGRTCGVGGQTTIEIKAAIYKQYKKIDNEFSNEIIKALGGYGFIAQLPAINVPSMREQVQQALQPAALQSNEEKEENPLPKNCVVYRTAACNEIFFKCVNAADGKQTFLKLFRYGDQKFDIEIAFAWMDNHNNMEIYQARQEDLKNLLEGKKVTLHPDFPASMTAVTLTLVSKKNAL